MLKPRPFSYLFLELKRLVRKVLQRKHFFDPNYINQVMSVDRNLFALLDEDDKNIMDFDISTDSSSSTGFQKDDECTSISVTRIAPVSPSNEATVPSSHSERDSNRLSNKIAFETDARSVPTSIRDEDPTSTSGPISMPEELRIQPSQPDDTPYTPCTEPSIIPDEVLMASSQTRESVSSALEPITSSNEIEVHSTVSYGNLTSIADEENTDEPFITRLLREAEELQRAKRLARAVPFDEGESDDMEDQSEEAATASHELGTFPPVMTLQNVDYYSTIEEPPARYYLSTDKPITKEMAREIFSRDTFPQVFSISPTPDDVSTLWGGTQASRDFRTSMASIRDDEESGLPSASDKTPPGQLPEEPLQSRWKYFCRDRTRIERFFGFLTLFLASVVVVLVLVVFAN